MAEVFKLPRLGSTMKEGTIAKWLKQEGETVSEDDILLSVETSKLTKDVEAGCDGIVLKILVEAGETVPCQTPICIIGEAGEDISEFL